jgi:hypothetical protein
MSYSPAADTDMTSIFISYRRDDSAGHAGRLFDRLVARYGAAAIFIDHYDLPPGSDFSATIESHIHQSRVVLAVIGPHWLEARDAEGKLRLSQPEDFVRRELLHALSAGKQIIPVLVGGVRMPSENEFPSDLAPLARLQACELRDSRFDDDFEALMACLSSLSGEPSKATTKSLAGSWVAAVTYPWGVTVTEKFEFELDGNELFGWATYLGAKRPLEGVELLEDGARFTLHSESVMGEAERRVAHRYRVHLDGNSLQVRLQSSGGFNDGPPIKFTATRDSLTPRQ